MMYRRFCSIAVLGILAYASPVGAQTLTEQLNRPAASVEPVDSLRSIADRDFRLGREQQAAGQLEAAIGAWQQAALGYQQLQDFSALGRVYEYLSSAYMQLGRSTEAEDALRRRLAIARDTQDVQGQVFGLNGLGTLLLARGNAAGAQILWLEANRIAQTIGDPAGQGLALSNLGLISLQQGQLEEAIKQFEVAIGFLRRTNESASEASTRNSLGDAYRAANQTRDALRSYLSALSLAEFRGDRANQFRAIDGLVAVYSQLGQPRAALDLLRDRLELAQQNPRQQLNTARLLAEFFVQMGDRNQATLYFQRAIAIAQQLEDTQQEGLLINRQASLGLTP